MINREPRSSLPLTSLSVAQGIHYKSLHHKYGIEACYAPEKLPGLELLTCYNSHFRNCVKCVTPHNFGNINPLT